MNTWHCDSQLCNQYSQRNLVRKKKKKKPIEPWTAVPQHRPKQRSWYVYKDYVSSILPVIVSASRVLTGMTSLLFGDRNAWRVALAVGETFREAADGRMGPSGRFGPTSSTVASLDAVATNDFASLSWN